MDITKSDLYGLLEVSPEASLQEIKTAYRKKALKVHPDKNPDNPEAAKLFHQLSEGLKVLLDESAKGAYDRVLRAKRETQLRNSKLDATRKRFKEELEAREKKYQEAGKKATHEATPEESLKANIERLRKHGSEELAREQERMRQEIAKQQFVGPNTFKSEVVVSGRLKVSWKPDPEKEDIYTHDFLHSLLYKYGDISALVLTSKKKKGSALVEYVERKHAELALSLEKGINVCPLTLSWMKGETDRVPAPSYKLAASQPAANPVPSELRATDFEDFEAKVLAQMMKSPLSVKRKVE